MISGYHLAEQQSLTKLGGERLRLPDLSESQMLLCFSPWSKPSKGRFTLNLGKQRGLTVDTDSSQVPQPTYSWKWVGESSFRYHCIFRNEDWEEDMFGLPAEQP